MLMSPSISTNILKALVGNGTLTTEGKSTIKSTGNNGTACGTATAVQLGAWERCYIGLSSTDPGTSGLSFTEPKAARNYKRIECHEVMDTKYASFQMRKVDDPEGGIPVSKAHTRRIGNTEEISFNEAVDVSDVDNEEAEADWGEIGWYGLFVNETDTVPYAWGKLTKPVKVPTHTKFIFRAGHFELYLDGYEITLNADGDAVPAEE